MKLSNLKTWLPGMILGLSLLAEVPVSADITNSGSTPPDSFLQVSSTNNVTTDSKNSDDSGKVYDFKDSRTSGVVTVTKSWDDSMSNDERPIPDVSISTVEPSKLNRTYTITFHGNGMKFADGSEENTVVYNGSGQIISGTYNVPVGAFVEWCFDTAFKYKAIFNDNGTLTSSFLNSIDHTSIDLYAKEKTFVLKRGSEFNSMIPSTATSIVFTDETMPVSATLIDVDEDGDDGVIAWMDGTTMIVSTQIKDLKIQSNQNSNQMFYNKNNLKNVDLTLLDTQNVTDMGSMFRGCSSLTTLDLTPLDTQKVTNMESMFDDCSGLTALDLSPLDTQKVTSMDSMFYNCNKLTILDLSPLDTSNVTNMRDMFRRCTGLIGLDLSSLDTQNVTDMSYYDCSGLTVLDLAPLDTGKITNMSYMFANCSGLTALDISHLKTNNVTNMSGMFYGCVNLINLNLSSIDTGNLQAAAGMFYSCRSLTSLDLSMLDFQNVSQVSDVKNDRWISGAMFQNCSALTTLKLPIFSNKISNYSRLFDNCNSLVSLDLSLIDSSNVTDMSSTFYRCYELTRLTIGDRFAFIGSDYRLPSGIWYASDGTAYTSDGKTCTIPNNKADTYIRK